MNQVVTITTTLGRFLPIGLLFNLHVLGSVIGVARNRVLCYEKMKDKREGGAHAARKHYDTRTKPSGEVDGLGPAKGVYSASQLCGADFSFP